MQHEWKRIDYSLFSLSTTGDKFWLLGSTAHDEAAIFDLPFDSKTAVWFKKKQAFIQGPNLPHFFTETPLDKYNKFCTLSLNSSHLIVFGIKIFGQAVFLFDFNNGTWTYLTPIPLLQEEELLNCFAAVFFEKNGNAKILLIIEKIMVQWVPNYFKLVLISSELIGNMEWKTLTTYSLDSLDKILSKNFHSISIQSNNFFFYF